MNKPINDQLVQGIKSVGNLYCRTGRINDYRRAFLIGRGGSRKDDTWKKNYHDCCKSKVYWTHKVKCPRLGDGNLPPDE